MLNFLLELCPFWSVKTFILPNFVKTLIERRVLLVFYAWSEIIQQKPHSFKNFLPKLVEGCENILFKNKKTQLPFMGALWLRTLSMSFNLGLSFLLRQICDFLKCSHDDAPLRNTLKVRVLPFEAILEA